MQLDTMRTQIKNACGQTVVQFVVLADGEVAGTFGTIESAFSYQEKLWNVCQNKTVESLYAWR